MTSQLKGDGTLATMVGTLVRDIRSLLDLMTDINRSLPDSEAGSGNVTADMITDNLLETAHGLSLVLLTLTRAAVSEIDQRGTVKENAAQVFDLLLPDLDMHAG